MKNHPLGRKQATNNEKTAKMPPILYGKGLSQGIGGLWSVPSAPRMGNKIKKNPDLSHCPA